ncbi:Putative F-box protein At5g38390 [Linum perenne]
MAGKNMRNHQNRIDRLSDLPDSILQHVLSFLDTKSLVQTCILSRRWRCVWKHVDVLTFSKSSFRDDLKFEQHVDRVLALRSDCSGVSRVAVDFWVGIDRRMETDLFDRIMRYAASHGVRELFIDTPHGCKLDAVGSMFACYQTLKALELQCSCIDETGVGLWSCLQLLESLTLTNCFIRFDDAFANLPRLEALKLTRCFHTEATVLKVTGSKLHNLEIALPGFDSLEIIAPRLQSLSLKIDCRQHIGPDMSESNLPFLSRASIELLRNKHVFCSYGVNDSKKQKLLKQCANLFKALHNVQALSIEVETFELLIETCNSMKHESSPFKRMKSLNLKWSGPPLDVVPDQVIRYFLGGSRNEEDKRFTVRD